MHQQHRPQHSRNGTPTPWCPIRALPARAQVFINITGVLTNNAESACACKRSSKDNCACVPDARVLPGGAGVALMPGVTAWSSGGTKPGRIYLVRYTATSLVAQLSCEGYARVCAIAQPKNLRGKPPPSCTPLGFDDPTKLRDATRCTAV